MCLIIANLDGREVPEAYVHRAFSQNHDGFGIMYVKDGLLKIRRGMFSSPQIVELLAKASEQALPYVAHFRYGTQGTKNTTNCHPFSISEAFKGIAMMHNGVFSDSRLTRAVNGKSDTHLMADWIQEAILANKMHPSELFSPQVQFLRDHFKNDLATYNKVVFMNGHGQINIVNEGLGYWVNGVWYSNTYSIGHTYAARAMGHEVIQDDDVVHNADKREAILAGNFCPKTIIPLKTAKDAEKDDDDLFAAFMGKNHALEADDDDNLELNLERMVPRRRRDKGDDGKFFFNGEEFDLSDCSPGCDDDEDTQPIELGDDLTRALAEAFGDTDIPDPDQVDEGDSTDWQAQLERYRNHSSQRPISASSTYNERLKDRESKLLAASVQSTVKPEEKKEFVTRTYGTGGTYTSGGTYIGGSYVYNSKANDIVELLLKP